MIPLSFDRPINTKGVRAFLLAMFLVRRDQMTYPRFCEARESHVKTDYAAALGTVPQLEEVGFEEDAPNFADFREFYMTWDNKLYKNRVAITREAFEFDQTGHTRRVLDNMAARLTMFPEKLFYSMIRSADTLPSVESNRNGNSDIAFFSDSHKWYSASANTMSNLMTGSTSAAAVAATAPQTIALQLQADFMNAVAEMQAYKDDYDQPYHPASMGDGQFVILCGPLMREAMRLAFKAGMINMTNNIFLDRCEVIVSPYLPKSGSEAADWYLFYLTPARNKPFLFSQFRQIRDEQIEDLVSVASEAGMKVNDQLTQAISEFAAMEILTNLNRRGSNADADVILNERYIISARWKGAMVPLAWPQVLKVNNG